MNLNSFSLPALLLVFAASAAAVWIAGIYLSNTTDVLATRFGLGEALGGLLLLAIVTNLPEIAITASAALQHDLGIAIGNILGGIAIQTVVLVVLDVFGLGKRDPLTYRAASLGLVLEGVLVIAVLTLAILGHELPPTLIWARMTPAGVGIAVVWIAGLFLIAKARTGLPWHAGGDAPGGQEKARGHAKKQKEQDAATKGHGTSHALLIFAAGALVTLVGGIALELTGDAIAKHIGMSGVLFGATVLAAATALPEVSTGLASVKLGDYKLAVSDIFGGNAFLPVLFLFATLLSGEAVLPKAQRTESYLRSHCSSPANARELGSRRGAKNRGWSVKRSVNLPVRKYSGTIRAYSPTANYRSESSPFILSNEEKSYGPIQNVQAGGSRRPVLLGGYGDR